LALVGVIGLSNETIGTLHGDDDDRSFLVDKATSAAALFRFLELGGREMTIEEVEVGLSISSPSLLVGSDNTIGRGDGEQEDGTEDMITKSSRFGSGDVDDDEDKGFKGGGDSSESIGEVRSEFDREDEGVISEEVCRDCS